MRSGKQDSSKEIVEGRRVRSNLPDMYTISVLNCSVRKNFANECNKEISGVELLKLALDVVKDMQYRGGGVVTFLEANNEAKLLKFYTDNRFAEFNVRQTAANQESPHKLVQLLRLL